MAIYGEFQVRIRKGIRTTPNSAQQYVHCDPPRWKGISQVGLPSCPILRAINFHSLQNVIRNLLRPKLNKPFFSVRLSAKYAFAKPNDRRALDLMNHAAEQTMREIPEIALAYGVSDEYR